MSLSVISPEKRNEESNIQQSIFDSIDRDEDIIFSSGAGSGKTYALVESLKHIINEHGLRLNTHNQKIICITYTNVAVEEVNDRLGNSELVLVSTIHERIWELIKDHQKALVEIHENKLNDEISILSNKLLTDSKFIKYQNLTEDQKLSFSSLMLSEKELFYKIQDENAAKIREILIESLHSYKDIIKNVSDFKDVVKIIYKITDYTLCLEKIKLKDKKFLKVIYNSSYNTDRLHWMRISHDTLIEYGLKIISKHKILQQIIIDKYPYFLIDEYQDTERKVVEIMAILSKRSKEIAHPFFVGYFGDTAQNIYDGGVGKSISKIHCDLKHILKPYNRRSTSEVITLINAIRNDEIQQESIYEDSYGGSVKFYSGENNKINHFIEMHLEKWNISVKNKLHCLVLTNKTVAEYSGFSNIYAFFSGTIKYRIAFNQLNTELLSDNISKLGEVPSLIYRIVDLRNKLYLKNTPVHDVLGKQIYANMDITSLRNFINSLKEIKGETLQEFLNSITIFYDNHESSHKLLLEQLFDYEQFPKKSFNTHLIELLYPNLKEEDLEEAQNSINKFLEINFSEFNLWYKYIRRESEGKIVYHTYHGTKGLEFDNVIILMENAFGRNRLYFKNFFLQLRKNTIDSDYLEQFEQTKNLIYVACSRAIKNLRILYLDDISEFKDPIEKIFTDVNKL